MCPQARPRGQGRPQGLHLCFALFSCNETKIVKKSKALNLKTVFVPILSFGYES